MKELLKTLSTPSNVKLLTGEDYTNYFPYRYPKATEKNKINLRNPLTLAELIKLSASHKIESFDPRFDGKHPIEIAIYNLQLNGFTKSQLYKLLKTKSAVNSKRITGGLKYLANFITDEYRDTVIAKLNEVTYERGQYLRNGCIF